ncbi:MYND-type domain-containing protein [Mycena chlorophos]|uniref:MYND-type domain-containing protein n=1 Tax=Mycena chlorophos TaxID=658473 RepID=A0A8H6WAL9_MYCCL|nr:MYND-type domain-containing protein [Mycena chlorophos]
MSSLSRQEILDLLAAMGVDLPPKTKLPDAELDKRFSKTLDSAQYLSRVVPDPPLDPSVYPSWLDKTRRAGPVLDGIRRHNVGEAGLFAQQRVTGTDPFPLYGNPFMDLRQTMMSIANTCDNMVSGGKIAPMVVQDEADTAGILMRVLDVRMFDKATPILVLIYRHDGASTGGPSPQSIEWLQDNFQPGKLMMKITATLKEQEMLLRVLKQNSKRIAKKYKPKRLSNESGFTLSFLLPIGPLPASDLAKLNTNNGCTVCGDPAKSKCARCGVMRYCGAECQKDDWKIHKPLCKDWQGGTWHSITFTTAQNKPGGLYVAYISKFDICQHQDIQTRSKNTYGPNVDASPPANTHGLTPFIVKVQIMTPNTPGLMGMPAMLPERGMNGDELVHVMIYDQKRGLDVMVMRTDTTATDWSKLCGVVMAQRQLIKGYAWAVRTGEWTLDICLNRIPAWQVW